jgi:hypothetical protein
MEIALRVLEGELAIVRLAPDAAVPAWLSLSGRPLASITVTEDETSIVCPARLVPEGVRCEADWRAFRVEGKLDFALTGILAAIVSPLAQAGISAYSLSTFDTDFVLVKSDRLQAAIDTLEEHFPVLAPDGARA